MSRITTHILDTSLGQPAAGVAVTLSRQTDDGDWEPLGSDRTNDDGRATGLLSGPIPGPGNYRLSFRVAEHFHRSQRATFFPVVEIVFSVEDVGQHFHVPLLLSPFGYSTYRGS